MIEPNERDKPSLTWMIFEDNVTWAIPKRPKFVITGTQTDIEKLIERIEFSRIAVGYPMAPDTHLTAEPIRMFESIDKYNELETAHYKKCIDADIKHRARCSFT